MVKVQVKKRGTTFQYIFEIAPQDGKRKWVTKSGFLTKAEAQRAGIKALNEYLETGHSFKPSQISYSDYLDYWMEEYCYVNLKHRTIETYKYIIKNHIKPRLGMYRLCQITTATIQEPITDIYVERGFAKSYMKSILKVIKSSFDYACEIAQFIKYDPAIKVKVPKYDEPDTDPAHIFTKEEIELIFDSVKNNHCVYYAFLTAYHTGLRISEVFGLTWDDIDLEKKKIHVRRNIVKKNQSGGTHKRLVEGRATTVWYFGTYKTKNSYRTIDIGDTLVEALKKYKEEQEIFEEIYGDMYMKHYKKIVENTYTKNQKPK